MVGEVARVKKVRMKLIVAVGGEGGGCVVLGNGDGRTYGWAGVLVM